MTVIDKSGSSISTIKMKDLGVYDVSAVDDRHVAVSCGDTNIYIVNVRRSKITKKFKARTQVYGITFNEGYTVFCACKIGIKELDVKKGKISDVYNDETVSYNSYISSDNNIICYSCHYTHTVTVLNSQFKVLFKFKDDLA